MLHPPHHLVRLSSNLSRVFPLSVHNSHSGTQVRNLYLLSQQERIEQTGLSAAAEEVQSAQDNDDALLHRHHGVYPPSLFGTLLPQDKGRLQEITRSAMRNLTQGLASRITYSGVNYYLTPC